MRLEDTARILSDYAANLTFDRIPPEVIECTRMYILDYYAACFAGIRVNRGFNDAMLPIICNMGGRGEASVFGQEDRLPAENAAFMNAIYAHGADMDDGNRKAMGHVAAHVMSAVFALAESLGDKTWEEVVTAILVGYEVYNRLAAMAQPGLVHRGFHSTGTAGTVACGAACGKLMGLDSDGIYNALGIASIQASGLLIITESGQACKPLNPANAAKTGILSAKLAAAGINGPERPLESKKGWLHAMTDAVHYDMLDDLGEVFTICESYLKPYPSCRHTHCGIEAAISIREALFNQGIGINAIRALRLYTYENAIRIAGQPGIPATPDQAKFSIRYCLANAMVTGHFNLEDLEKETTEDVIRMLDRIELIADPAMEDTRAGIRGAKLAVQLADDRIIERTVLLPKGDAANPFVWEDLEQKLAGCMQGDADSVKMIVEYIRDKDLTDRYTGIKEVPGVR